MDENGGIEPDRVALWDITHKKKDGSYANEETQQKLSEAYHRLSLRSSDSGEVSKEVADEVFIEVTEPEHSSRVTGFGCGLTLRDYYGVQFHKLPNSCRNELDMTRIVEEKLAEQQAWHDKKLAAVVKNMSEKIDYLMELILLLRPEMQIEGPSNTNGVSSSTNHSSLSSCGPGHEMV